MTNDSVQEKRQSKRYLCDEFFTQITLQTLEGSLDITDIDFNKEGIGLFSNEVIPESGNVSLSIQYKNPLFIHMFNNLPCSIVHSNLTEVGTHCGVRFKLEELARTDRNALDTIESYLIKSDDPDDRYHLLDGD